MNDVARCIYCGNLEDAHHGRTILVVGDRTMVHCLVRPRGYVQRVGVQARVILDEAEK